MRKLATIAPSFWLSDDAENLIHRGHDYLAVLVYLWTGPETPVCGLMPLATAQIAAKLRIRPQKVEAVLIELQDAGLIDHDGRLIWLKGYIEVQLGGMPNMSGSWIANTSNALSALPDCDLVSRYRDHYKVPKDCRKPKKRKTKKVAATGVTEQGPRQGGIQGPRGVLPFPLPIGHAGGNQ